jgi:hypothetical protein
VRKKTIAMMRHTNKFLSSITLASLLLSGATAVIAADPPKDEAVIPWTRKATKDMTPNRKQGPNEQKSVGVSDAAVYFIAPKTTGFTTKALPDVFWYINTPAKAVTFTLVSPTKKTELRLELKDVQSGLHRIDLEKEAKKQNFQALEANDWTPADNAAAPTLKAEYRMALKSADPKLLATAYIARVQPPPGADAKDYTLQIKNELWFDAVGTLTEQLTTDPKKPAPRKQFSQLLLAEDVLKNNVGDQASDEQKRKARAEEERVLGKLSVPDPIDVQSDSWTPKSVPDPIDVQGVPDPIDLQGKQK